MNKNNTKAQYTVEEFEEATKIHEQLSGLKAAMQKVFKRVKPGTIDFEDDSLSVDLEPYGIQHLGALLYTWHTPERKEVTLTINMDAESVKTKDLPAMYTNIAITLETLASQKVVQYRRGGEYENKFLDFDIPVRREGDLEQVLKNVKYVGKMQRAYKTMEETQ